MEKGTWLVNRKSTPDPFDDFLPYPCFCYYFKRKLHLQTNINTNPISLNYSIDISYKINLDLSIENRKEKWLQEKSPMRILFLARILMKFIGKWWNGISAGRWAFMNRFIFQRYDFQLEIGGTCQLATTNRTLPSHWVVKKSARQARESNSSSTTLTWNSNNTENNARHIDDKDQPSNGQQNNWKATSKS